MAIVNLEKTEPLVFEIQRAEEIVQKATEMVMMEELPEEISEELEIDITLTDNDTIQSVNREQRQLDNPTDVLSFPMYEGKEDLLQSLETDMELILGDIMISVDKVKEQAEEYGHSTERELGFLVVHGMLHLLGYDHIEEEDRRMMREKEEYYLQKLDLRRD